MIEKIEGVGAIGPTPVFLDVGQREEESAS